MTTVNQAAEERYPGKTFDTALPQQWVDAMSERGFDVRRNFVTLYPKDSVAYMASTHCCGSAVSKVLPG